ncbi:MAG: PorP/SprF family type IX secretion system membrane protein [Paludibacteraceae bacterium]
MTHQHTNKTIKRFLTGLFSLIVLLPASAQFEAQVSQYMLNTPAYNPASIAENGMINATGQFRQQWLNMPGAPQTLYFTISTPFMKSEKASNGVGIKFLRDGIGAFVNQSGHLQYAYKRKLGKNTLSLGADLGFVGVSFIADSVRAELNSEYHERMLEDTAVPTTDETGMSLDLSLGAFYSTPKYYLGISYVHLNAPSVKINDDHTQFNVPGVIYATGGYDLSFSDPKWMLRSSALFKSDFVSWQGEVSSRLEYDEKFWAGLGYRYQDAVVVYAGINLLRGLLVGFSYDVPASKMIKATYGTPEVLISYSFAFDFGSKSKYKSIRIL